MIEARFKDLFKQIVPGAESDFQYEIKTDSTTYYAHEIILPRENPYLIVFNGFVISEKTDKKGHIEKTEKSYVPMNKVILPISKVRVIFTNFA